MATNLLQVLPARPEIQRWDEIEAALGSLQNSEHDWDRDPAGWVRSQRRVERNSVG
jgi:hypothetical protein